MLKRSSYGDQIYELLKDSIIKGELKPGDRIVELEVARNNGVSQAPVREALLRLNEDGFVVTHRHKGTFVSTLTKKDIKEIYSLREVIEVFAIERAVERITPEDFENLNQSFQEMLEAGWNNDLTGIRTADINFHTHIYRIADHELMFQVWELLRGKADRFWYLTSEFYFSSLSELAKIHEPLLNALHKRDRNDAIRAFREHLNFVREKLFVNMNTND